MIVLNNCKEKHSIWPFNVNYLPPSVCVCKDGSHHLQTKLMLRPK